MALKTHDIVKVEVVMTCNVHRAVSIYHIKYVVIIKLDYKIIQNLDVMKVIIVKLDYKII